MTASTASLIYALIAAGERGWLTQFTGWLVLAAAVGYVLFVVWQRRARSPLMDVRLLARRPVAAGAFLILMATALMIAVFFLGTFYFQQAQGYGALHTGLLFLPVAVATMLGANLTGRVIGRWGGRALSRRRTGGRGSRPGRTGRVDASRRRRGRRLRRRRGHRRAVRRRLGDRAWPGGAP
ncbi:hypothetical protein ACFSTC_20500 [Nonomuraea ferruginea]